MGHDRDIMAVRAETRLIDLHGWTVFPELNTLAEITAAGALTAADPYLRPSTTPANRGQRN